jgi:hypothetical protein
MSSPKIRFEFFSTNSACIVGEENNMKEANWKLRRYPGKR